MTNRRCEFQEVFVVQILQKQYFDHTMQNICDLAEVFDKVVKLCVKQSKSTSKPITLFGNDARGGEAVNRQLHTAATCWVFKCLW